MLDDGFSAIHTYTAVKPTEVKVSQLTQVLVADKEAVLECSTFGSRPKAIIYWNFDGQRFNTPLNGTVSKTFSFLLFLSSLSSFPLLSRFLFLLLSCHFRFFIPSSTGADNFSSSLLFSHPPPVFSFHHPSFSSFFFSFLPFSLSDSFTNFLSYNTVGALGEHQTSTTITITPKQEHNGAEITCISENPKIPASTISDHLRLDVQCKCVTCEQQTTFSLSLSLRLLVTFLGDGSFATLFSFLDFFGRMSLIVQCG